LVSDTPVYSSGSLGTGMAILREKEFTVRLVDIIQKEVDQ